jgi:hypothetical protein
VAGQAVAEARVQALGLALELARVQARARVLELGPAEVQALVRVLELAQGLALGLADPSRRSADRSNHCATDAPAGQADP